MREQLLKSISDVIRAAKELQSEESIAFIEAVASAMAECFRKGGKVIIAGNGGSLCDAMHFAEELTGIYRKKRAALPAIALCEPGHLTCVSNDIGYEEVFSRGVEAYGREGDILIVLTTSGNSKNLIRAVERARSLKLFTIAFLGKNGGTLKSMADLEWIVSGFTYSDRIQEAHMAAIHMIIEMLEYELFAELKEQAKLYATA